MEQPNKNIFVIDPNNLEASLLVRATNIFEYGTRLADVKAEIKAAKHAHKTTSDDIKSEVRGNPASFGFEGRVTIDAIDTFVATQPQVREIQKRMNEFYYEADVLGAALNGLEALGYDVKTIITNRELESFSSNTGRALPSDIGEGITTSIENRGK